MYGKLFSSMYEGSMFGSGATVFAVMGYVIARQQPPDFEVELNPKLLAAILGEPEDEVLRAIEFLCAPDPNSRTPDNEGRRLVKVGTFAYRVVNGKKYHDIRTREERRIYNREAQRRFRSGKEMDLTEPVHDESTEPCNSETLPCNKPSNGAVAPKRFIKPSIEECRLHGAKIGMSEQQIDHFFNYYESNGWRVGRNPMKSLPHAMAMWKSRSDDYGGGASPSSAKPQKPLSPMDIRTVIQAKQTLASEIKNKYCSDTAMDSIWSDPKKREQYFSIKKEIKQLNEKLGSMGI